MKKLCILSFVILFNFSLTSSLLAENLPELLKKVESYANEGNYTKAIAELEWVKKELEKGNQGKLQELFPTELAGFTRGKVESANLMGMSNTECSYTKGSESVKVSLIGGSGGGPLAGLAGLGQMAAAFGGQPGMDAFRINGRTAQLQGQELTVFLDSGSMLKFEGATGDTLKAMAEGIGVDKLDAYLKGQ